MTSSYSSTPQRNASVAVSADEIRRLFHYDPDTGIFTRKVSVAARNGHVGAVCGYKLSHGYTYMRIKGKQVSAHRMAWIYVYGVVPLVVDHINGDTSDNRIVNLRNVNTQLNAQNIKKCRENNQSKVLGAFRNGNGFSSHIKHNGKVIYLGYFKTAEEAHQCYLKAKRKLHLCNTL